MFSTIGFQVARLLGLAPIGMPRNLKGIDSERQDKKAEPAVKNVEATFTPYNLLLTKLIFKPDTNSKLLRRVLIVHKLSQVPSPVKMVSSANWSI
ncbi:hypothetical protein QL285_011970 [Trifolium repens]|nr:hypothetical protein QL285_011970 [Trifolium repens]